MTPVLSDSVLQKFDQRAPKYDESETFFQEDFDDLKKAGYLTLNVPKELGGKGYTLAQIAKEQRRLAYYAAPTALAINMHLYWVGVAADLWRSGDKSLEWLLKDAMNGEIFAAGHAETGNDLPVLLSTTKAERVDGGYRFTGRKSFGSLGPAWTYLGLHGMTAADGNGGPKVVHGFMPRGAKGSKTHEVWNVLGMRATRSEDTELDGVFIPDKHIARVLTAGPAGADMFIVAIFAWALIGFGNIYYGQARRVFDIIVDNLKSKKSIAVSRTMAHHPGVQNEIADMWIALEAIEPYLDRVAQEWTEGVDHGATWPARIVAAKHFAVEQSWKVVDSAIDLAGGFGIFRKAGLERFFRDGRLGRIHPANPFLTREIVGKTAFGIGLDESPRWG